MNVLETLKNTIKECDHFKVEDDDKVITALKFMLCFKTDEKSYNTWNERFNTMSTHPDNLQDNTLHSPDCLGTNSIEPKGLRENQYTINVYWCDLKQEFIATFDFYDGSTDGHNDYGSGDTKREAILNLVDNVDYKELER